VSTQDDTTEDTTAEESGAGSATAGDTGSGDTGSGDDGRSGGAENADPEAMEDAYEPGTRATVVVPGTRGAVSGTAFADQVDDVEEAKTNPAIEDPWIRSEHEDDEDQQPRGGDDAEAGTENVGTASGDADKSREQPGDE
jgi:hypothetical protein